MLKKMCVLLLISFKINSMHPPVIEPEIFAAVRNRQNLKPFISQIGMTNASGNSPLAEAIMCRNVPAVKYLLRNRADTASTGVEYHWHELTGTYLPRYRNVTPFDLACEANFFGRDVQAQEIYAFVAAAHLKQHFMCRVIQVDHNTLRRRRQRKQAKQAQLAVGIAKQATPVISIDQAVSADGVIKSTWCDCFRRRTSKK